MMLFEQLSSGWPLAASLAIVVGGQGLLAGRRRRCLNEAMHELRRPLQALALACPSEERVVGSLRLAGAALERMEDVVNGGGRGGPWERVSSRQLAEAAVDRWRAGARSAGRSLRLDWRAGAAAIRGDAVALSQALDNLIANALEHGRGAIVVEAWRAGGHLRIRIRDRGASGLAGRRRRRDRRRGHGLRIVRQIAGDHGGRFVLRRTEGGAVATMELPLANGTA